MPERILILRELNRATLERQFLLARTTLSPVAVIEHLAGMQAQAAAAPFIGLWTRIADFSRADLTKKILERKVVKATLMRGTLHLFSAADYLKFRTTIQPMLIAGAQSILKNREPVDSKKVVKKAQELFSTQSRSFAEITSAFGESMPDADPGVIRYTIRTAIPLVQEPVASGWNFPGNPKFTLAEPWLGKKFDSNDNLKALLFRYLAAFGPASITDMQTWSGFPKLKDLIEKLRPELVTYRDETKRELFDLPTATIPDADVDAPVRFLPEFDNILLGHQKRTRVIADVHRTHVYLPALRVASTILIDGFVAGVWKVEKTKTSATLVITPFDKVPRQIQKQLTEEAEPLVRFIEPDVKTYAVKFV